ncbi:MAG: hypothetical protein IPJ69_14880 [Deltaproteobacteria bacterium]|nr:MAG: hypothetical protein IPJ69_14880 [Deltaproteobacteria bacterium]
MSTYKNLSHHQKDALQNKLPLYRPLDSLVEEGSKHKSKIISSVVVIVVLGLIYSGMAYYQIQYQSKASDLLQKGNTQAVIQQYPKSDAAILAHIKLGEESLKNEKFDEAISHYQFLTEKKSIPPLIKVGASQNLALAYLKKGQNDLALDILKKLSLDPQNIHQDYSKLLEAHVWEVKGDESKSQEIYKQLSEGSVSNEIKEEAKARLKVAVVTPPAEVKIEETQKAKK